MWENFVQSTREYPVLYIVVILAAILCLFLWGMAMRSSKRRQQRKDALIAVLEREKAMREEFKTLTQQKMIDTPPERLVEGVCCHIQMELEQQPEMQAAYDALNEPQRLIYALGYVVQDTRDGLSEFFRKNGQPLTGAALEAVERLVGGEYARLFQQEYEAFDDENETASLIKEEIVAADKRFAVLLQEQGERLYDEAKEYLLANSSFITN